jgi:MSHA pilin protein MshA
VLDLPFWRKTLMSKSNQRGFTLIELIVVIVVLGVLAAFAVPRFMGVEVQARVAAVNGLGGSLRSSASMAHGVWLAQGSPASITVDGKVITILNGYPDVASMQNTIQDLSGFTVAAGTFTKTGAPATCNLVYAPATAGPPALPPTVTISASTANC